MNFRQDNAHLNGLSKTAVDPDWQGQSKRFAVVGLRLALTAVAVLLACASVVGCGGEPDVRTVRGYVVGVESKTLLELDFVQVRTEAGETIEISARGKHFPGFPPSHLREHMMQGLPVTVSYHRENGELVLDDVRD